MTQLIILMKKYADLHLHTSCSDGSNSVIEVMKLAIDNNVEILSFTDHNTLDAYSEQNFNLSRQMGLILIPGVELDVLFNNKQFHLLGYGVDVSNKRLREVCEYNAVVQEEYNVRLLRYLEDDEDRISEKEYHQYEIPKVVEDGSY